MQKKRPKHLDIGQIRLPVPGIVSILHRISGALMFLFGLPFILYLFQQSIPTEISFETYRAFVASPLTPLHPALSSGMVSAFIEAWLRKPTYADFLSLRDDTSEWRGWWRNRVLRILQVFLLSNLGAAIGTYIAGFRIYDRLFS